MSDFYSHFILFLLTPRLKWPTLAVGRRECQRPSQAGVRSAWIVLRPLKTAKSEQISKEKHQHGSHFIYAVARSHSGSPPRRGRKHPWRHHHPRFGQRKAPAGRGHLGRQG